VPAISFATRFLNKNAAGTLVPAVFFLLIEDVANIVAAMFYSYNDL